ncbi:MAG: alpha/beta hydrolase [Pseudomonadota bacterium]
MTLGRIGLLVLLLSVAGPAWADITASRDIAYGSHPEQAYDIYFDQSAKDAPMIIMLHGGAWAFGRKEADSVWKDKATYFVPRGYVFASVETRLLGDGADPRRQAEDLARAVAHMRANAARWGADGSQVVLIGHSAGAHVAALVGADRELRRVAGPLAGVVVLDTGTLDLVGLMQNDPRRLFTRAFGRDRAYWAFTSPRERLDSAAPPYLVFCRMSDDVCGHARHFADRARQLGVGVSVRPTAKSHRAFNADVGRDLRYTAAIERWMEDALR